MTDRGEHWDEVFLGRETPSLTWFQPEPATSLRLIDTVVGEMPRSLVDVGAGTSYLVDRLLDRGVADVTLVDVSSRALDEVRGRLGERAAGVTLVCADVTTWEPGRRFEVWHDRAVFHFLVDPADRDRYVAVVESAVAPGGTVVLATFAEDGPTQCSGLPVQRYSADELATLFGDHFELVTSERELHRSPAGVEQWFTWLVLRRVDDRS